MWHYKLVNGADDNYVASTVCYCNYLEGLKTDFFIFLVRD